MQWPETRETHLFIIVIIAASQDLGAVVQGQAAVQKRAALGQHCGSSPLLAAGICSVVCRIDFEATEARIWSKQTRQMHI